MTISPAIKELRANPASLMEARILIKLPRFSGLTTEVTRVVAGTFLPLATRKKLAVVKSAKGRITGGRLVMAKIEKSATTLANVKIRMC